MLLCPYFSLILCLPITFSLPFTPGGIVSRLPPWDLSRNDPSRPQIDRNLTAKFWKPFPWRQHSSASDASTIQPANSFCFPSTIETTSAARSNKFGIISVSSIASPPSSSSSSSLSSTFPSSASSVSVSPPSPPSTAGLGHIVGSINSRRPEDIHSSSPASSNYVAICQLQTLAMNAVLKETT
ncbi:unnamed protein product [Protopolystoma xenopodis]|uniref:Uncharacterized protein n=1 Tax=Protopolystoma xenopodis TaxID=117903 RepID=A0A448WE28_9PLAT|nr:unnamed protein product [Protopolystoma xenopodis]